MITAPHQRGSVEHKISIRINTKVHRKQSNVALTSVWVYCEGNLGPFRSRRVLNQLPGGQ